MSTYAWKFIIPPHEWRPIDPNTNYKGCGAVVLADTEEQAKERLHTWAAENGLDSRWIDVADVRRVLPVPGAVLMWSQL